MTMMPPLVEQNTAPLPPELSAEISRPLGRVALRASAMRLALALLHALAAILSGWLLLVITQGLFPHMPLLLRLVLAAAAWVVFFSALVFYLRPAMHRVSARAAARSIDEALPETHERVSSAVQLSAEPDHPFAGSRELIGHLVHQAEQDMAELNAGRVVSAGMLRNWGLACGGLALVWLILWPIFPRMLATGVTRTFAPWAAVPNGPQVPMNVAPGNTTVAQGDSVKIRVHLGRAHSHKELIVSHASLITRYGRTQKISTDMQRTSIRAFRTDLRNVRQDFTYRIRTPFGNSPWYTVKVRPRPAITRLTIHYHYPAYTNKPAVTQKNATGAITALEGTQVQVVVHVSQPLAADSKLVLGQGTVFKQTLPLTLVNGHAYQATLVVRRTTDYRIKLSNIDGLGNRRPPAHPIVALRDHPPTISIVSPKPQVQVRPDDIVPVRYVAADDFGLSVIEARVRVNDQPPRTVRLRFPPGAGPVRGRWPLHVSRFLPAGFTGPERVLYKLKAADNHQPAAQWAASQQQELIINPTLADSFAQRRDRKIATALSQAMEKELALLKNEHMAARKLAAINPDRVLRAQERHQANVLKRALAHQSRALAAAAKKALHSAYRKAARTALAVARKPMRQAAGDMARVALNAAHPKQRQAAAVSGKHNVGAAQKRLAAAEQQLQNQQGRRQAMFAMRNALYKQQQAAANKNAAQKRQQQLAAQQALKHMIAKNKALQQPAVVKNAQRLHNLIQNMIGVLRYQKSVLNQLNHQNAIRGLQADATALASRQQQLNQLIKHFQQTHAHHLSQAHAAPPTPVQMHGAQTNIAALHMPQALEAMHNAVQRLNTVASQLDRRAKAHNPQKQAMLTAAQAALNQANVAGQKMSQLAGAQTHLTPAGKIQKYQKLINTLRQKARRMLAYRIPPAQRQQLQQALKQANVAAAGAAQHNLPKLTSALSQANTTLTQAAQAVQTAAQNQTQQQQLFTQAANRARVLASQEQTLAQQAAHLRQRNHALHAGRNSLPEIAKRQHIAAQRIAKGQALAQKLAAATQDAAPALASMVQHAQGYLNVAHDQQQQARAAVTGKNIPAATERQQESREKLKHAVAILLEKLHGPQLTQHGWRQHFMPHHHPPTANNLQHEADRRWQHDQQAKRQLTQAEKAFARGQLNEHPHAQPQPGQPQGQHEPGGHQGQHGHQGQQQAGHQGQHQGGHQGQQQAGHQGQQQGGHQGQQQGGHQGQQQGGHQGQQAGKSGLQSGKNGQAGKTGPAGKGALGMSQRQAMLAAAEQVQKALQQENQALAGHHGAAQQAEQSLSNAQRAFSQMSGSQLARGMGQGKGHSSQQMASKIGMPGGASNGHGYMLPPGTKIVQVPATVSQMGISPADWALLPPKQQHNLLGAAQQNGPPAYRRMIKNYYARIAQLEARHPGARQ